MKRINIFLSLIFFAFTSISISCGSSNKKATENVSQTEVKSSAMEIDSLLANADSLTNKEITFQGVCTHTCKHGATKMFMMGSDDTKTIRVEAASLGSFDTKCINSLVTVTGILREERIDEAYLAKWETRVAEANEKTHGETVAGCDSEKKARGEKGNSIKERIADFRRQISEREAACGKAYLSFYYVEALSYKIQ